MLCTFTTEQGNLIVRSDDIRAVEDAVGGCKLMYLVGTEVYHTKVKGTALENRDRIQQEELDLIDRVNQHHLKAQMQAQMQQQMAQSVQPKVPRGRAS